MGGAVAAVGAASTSGLSMLRRLEVGEGCGGVVQLTRLVERPGMRLMQVPSAMHATVGAKLPWRAPYGNGGGCDARRMLAAVRRDEVRGS